MTTQEDNVAVLKSNMPQLAEQSLHVTPLLVGPVPVSPTHMTIQLPTQEDVTENRREKCASCCKRFIAFLFSTVGLSTLMVAYTIMGGFIFSKLEGDREEDLKSGMAARRQWHVQRLWNVTIAMNVFYKENWTAAADALFVNYSKNVYVAATEQGWDGKADGTDQQWTFTGALLYSVTVITTIGYGHITPKTPYGRVVTIIYAIFGIPLTLLTLTNIGSFMATVFRFLYANVLCGVCCVCCVCCPRRHRRRNRRLPSDSFKSSNRWSKRGVKEFDAVENGKAGTSGESLKPKEDCVLKMDEDNPVVRDTFKQYVRSNWHNSMRRLKTTDGVKHVTVPIYISLLILTTYILGGAALFSSWETDWTFLEGSYFCFITLTTIGFGDYVPGASVDSRGGQEKLAICAMYVVFGLSLIAMCFDLMQEEARSKCRALGRKLGLLQD